VQSRGSAAADNFVGSADKTGIAASTPRPADWRAVEELLGLLARAIQQLHTYPATSPLCVSAIEACQRALAALGARENLTFRVTPAELIVDDIPTGRGTQVGNEIGRRLHRASVAAVTIDRGASARELARFCEDLVRCGERGAPDTTLLEMLTEHGIDRIAVTMSSRPEVLEVGPVPESAAFDVARTRARFESQIAKGGYVNHLYPPQKGWVRVDPSASAAPMSLLDLAVLADNPANLASMLLRLTDDAADVPPEEALERKYSDVAMLISSLDPAIARRMFGKLARAVLDLEPASRQALLRRTVLPGLLDGRVDGAILRDFPDVDLAESLCLLLDLETAAPELLSTALSRLDLPADRHAAMLPLIDEQLREREEASQDSERQSTLTRHARELMKIDGKSGKSFAEFAAFDLALDDAARSTLDQIRASVPASDTQIDQLTCLGHLMCLEPNPEAVDGFLERSFELLHDLEIASRGPELPAWIASYRELADRLRDTRPDVAATIGTHLTRFCTPERAAWLADLSIAGPDGRRAAGQVVAAVGPAVAEPLVGVLERESAAAKASQTRAKAAAQLLIEHAAVLAPGIAPLIERRQGSVLRTLLRALGSAGPGHEDLIGAHVTSSDDQTAREALRALARVGTHKASGLVVAQIVRQRGAASLAAEETLWHFPPAEAQRRTRELLARRDFTISHPQAAERLLDRVARAGAADLAPVLAGLASLRFRIWKPAVARVARKAHGMLSKQ
jgi:hypothetical protein